MSTDREALREELSKLASMGCWPNGDPTTELICSALKRIERLLTSETHPRSSPLPLRIKRIGNHQLPLPSYAHEGDAGLDVCAVTERAESVGEFPLFFDNDKQTIHLQPGDRAMIPVGWAFEIPMGYEGQLRPRSGLAKRGIVGVLGTIDAGYRGEVWALLENHSPKALTINHGDRIAQLVVSPVARCELSEIDGELGETARGATGFGSTGT